MKKITAFFMALMPLLITILLFAAGLIVKNSTHVYVTAVELPVQNVKILKADDTEKQYQLEANVLPKNATNPKVKWEVSDDNVITINDQGVVSCKDWGEAYVYATSEENPTLSSACKVDVYDTKIHSISIANEYESSYIGFDQRQKLNITTKPSLSHVANQTLNYEVTDGSDVVKVSKDGTILPIKEGKATIKITSADEASKAVKEFTVNVGKGVNTICLDDPNKETITEENYNLFDHIQTAPEKIVRDTNVSADEQKIKDTDFTYTVDNESIATVNERGQITFLVPGTAKFNISYKRNPEIKTTKTIECTCQQLKQVYFEDSSYATNYGSVDNLDNIVNWYVYPFNGSKEETKKVSGVEILSSNENVVKAFPGNDGTPTLKVMGVGSTTLTAKIKVSDSEYKTDTCQVNIYLPVDNVTKENTVTIDSCYYPLRNNIKELSNINTQFGKNLISFKLDDGEENAELMSDEILHIKDPSKEINITVNYKTTTQTKTATFKVKTTAKQKDVEFNKTLVIPAGQITKINGYTPRFILKSYNQYFTYDDEGMFIPKCGADIEEFEVRDASGNRDYIHLIVTENPLYISSNTDTLHITNDYEVNFLDTVAPKVFPETSRKSDGSKYTLNLTYIDPLEDQTATFEDDYITFNKAGTAEVIAKSEIGTDKFLTEKYTITSTYGDTLRKFTIKNGTDAEALTYSNYETLSWNADGTIKLYCPQVKWADFDNISIKSTTGLCNVSKDWEGLVLTGNIVFTINKPVKNYGKDVIEISTATRSMFFYVNVDAIVTDIIVTRAGVELENTNKTYDKQLKLRALALPACVENPNITATFNGTAVTIGENNLLTLPDTGWNVGENNTLVLSSGDFSKEIKFNYSEDTPKFWIDGAQDNNLYLSANATQKTCIIKTDGFVSDSWYSNLRAEYTSKELGETYQIDNEFLTLSGISLPEAEDYKPYANTFTIWLDGKKEETRQPYTMGRDFVSYIEFPNHNNNDMTDKKGLQKVHVYGNHSFYKEDMKEVDYYKLPVTLYDYRRREIKNTETNPDAVFIALNTLKASFGKSSASYEFTNDGYIKIKFHKDDLYTFDEVANDKFDNKTNNKNVTFTLSTKSNDASAKYTFVAVEGINQYCQEGLYQVELKQTSSLTSVLQTNFGLKETVKDNTPFDDRRIGHMYRIYGNGFTLNADAYVINCFESGADAANIDVARTLNATVIGSSKETMKKYEGKTTEYYVHADIDETRLIKYSTIMGFTQGMNLTHKNKDVYLSKSCFRGNKLGVWFFDGSNPNQVYMEDCIIFDAAGMPAVGFKSNLHIKGFLDIYNFHGQEVLKEIPGMGDLSPLWPIIENIGREKDMLNRGADGRTYVNTFLADVYFEVYFWDFASNEYKLLEHGLPGSGQYLSKFANVGIPRSKYSASMWATPNAATHQGAPSYYDEFDKDGNVRLDFLYNQMVKITREIHYF